MKLWFFVLALFIKGCQSLFYTSCITKAVLFGTTATESHQLGMKVFDNIKTILYHVQSINTDLRTSKTTNPIDTTFNGSVSTLKNPENIMKTLAAKPSTIVANSMCPQLCKFHIDWTIFKTYHQFTYEPTAALQCLDDTLQNTLVNTVPDSFCTLTKYNFLHTLEDIMTKTANPTVHWLTFSSLFQSIGEPIQWLCCTIKICFFWLWVQLFRVS